jgi:hypothetical protein
MRLNVRQDEGRHELLALGDLRTHRSHRPPTDFCSRRVGPPCASPGERRRGERRPTHDHPTGGTPVNSCVAHPARVYNAWLGGRDAILQYVPDADCPHALTRRLLDALAPGSHLVLSHPAADIGAEKVAASMRGYNERAADHAGATPRTHSEITRFFDGTELLDPGVVQLPEWHPDPADAPAPGALPMWCGVGRKP